MKIKYAPKDSGCLPENAYELEVEGPIPPICDICGDEIGEDYHYSHDGWDCSWPIVFEVWDMTHKKIGEIEVDREMAPVFNSKPHHNDSKRNSNGRL